MQHRISLLEVGVELKAEVGGCTQWSIWRERPKQFVVRYAHEQEPDNIDDSIAVRVLDLLEAL